MRAALNQMAGRQQAPRACCQNRNHRSKCEGFDHISQTPDRELIEELELPVDYQFPNPSRSPASRRTRAQHRDSVLGRRNARPLAAVRAARSLHHAQLIAGTIGSLTASPEEKWPTLA